jgi:MFS family permease
LRRNRDFRRIYLASTISLGGDWFLVIALFSLVEGFTGSALAVGFLLLVQDFTSFVLSPIAGVLVDRLDRRKLMVVADLARAVLCVGFLFARDPGALWAVYVLYGLLSAFSTLFFPASSAAMPNLVDEDDLSTANALSGSLWGTMLAIGAGLGGIVTAAVGRDAAIGIDAVSFVVSAALLVGIRRPFTRDRQPEHLRMRDATVETVRYARRDHRVLALLAVKGGWAVAGGVLVVLPILAKDVFDAGDFGIGLLLAARGVGALIGPFLGRAVLGPEDRRLFLIIGLSLTTFGVGYALVGLAPGLGLALVAVCLAHIGGGGQWMLSSYGLQRIVPDRIRGRIFAFDFMFVTLTFGLSSVVTGALVDIFGPRPTAIGLGAVGLAWAAVWTVLTTDVRRATMLEGCGAPPELTRAVS